MLKRLFRHSVDLLPYSVRTHVRNIPVLRSLQRWAFRRFLAGNDFDYRINAGPARGLHYPVSLPRDKNIWTGTYEPEFSAEIARRVTSGAVCYDIGGYRGFCAGLMGCRGASKVFTFEPFPENVAQIRRMIVLNANLAIELVPQAVSSQVGEATFEVMPESSMGRLSQSRFDSGGAVPVNRISVPQISLDHFVFVEGHPLPDLMKIDVEGAETDVLRGAARVLVEGRSVLLIEVHSPEIGRQCHELLQHAGYQVRILETGGIPGDAGHPPICHYLAEKNVRER